MDRRKFLKGVTALTAAAVAEGRDPPRKSIPGAIEVDPDVLAEIRRKAPDESPSEAYHKLITESMTFDYNTDIPEVEAE